MNAAVGNRLSRYQFRPESFVRCSGSGHQLLDTDAKRRDAFVDLAVNLADGRLKGIDLLLQPQEKAVVRHDVA
jgi:hypothetical protein